MQAPGADTIKFLSRLKLIKRLKHIRWDVAIIFAATDHCKTFFTLFFMGPLNSVDLGPLTEIMCDYPFKWNKPHLTQTTENEPDYGTILPQRRISIFLEQAPTDGAPLRILTLKVRSSYGN